MGKLLDVRHIGIYQYFRVENELDAFESKYDSKFRWQYYITMQVK